MHKLVHKPLPVLALTERPRCQIEGDRPPFRARAQLRRHRFGQLFAHRIVDQFSRFLKIELKMRTANFQNLTANAQAPVARADRPA